MNTRIRPTPYADIHLGTAYISWWNWHYARATGGKFILIVDDTNYYATMLWAQSWSIETAVARLQEDLEWLGMVPNLTVYSSSSEDGHHLCAAQLNVPIPRREGVLPEPIRSPIPLATRYSQWFAICPFDYPTASTAYHPFFVLQRVVDDHHAGIQAFVRGADLLPEMQLYDHFARSLGYVPPDQLYVPLVRREGALGKEAKSGTGGISIRDLREAGYEPDWIIQTLRECEAQSCEGRRDAVIIPEGVLEPAERKWLPYRDRELAIFQEFYGNGHLRELPWASEVLAAISERLGDEPISEGARAHEALREELAKEVNEADPTADAEPSNKPDEGTERRQ